MLDSERVEIVVSGSSARMLSREVHTSLRGRGMETVIRPFSFREFLRYRGEEPEREAQQWTSAERSLVEKRFREYLVEGGIPETQGLSPALRFELLQGYVDTVLFRDVVERYGVSQVAALRWLVRQCLRNPAGSFSVHRLHQDLKAQGHGVAKDAVHAMLGYLLDAFLLGAVPLATESERQAQLESAQALPGGPGTDPRLRRERSLEPGPRIGDGRAERAGAAQGERGLREDRGRIRGGLLRPLSRWSRRQS